MKIIFVIIAAVLVLIGCASTPTGNIEAFGLATSNITEKIDSMVSDYNAANINDQLVVMAQSDKKYVRSDFDPIKKIIMRNSDKKNFALYKANKALGDYSESLTALARAGSKEEIAMAGVKLSTSLKEMNEQYKDLSENNSDLISDESGGSISRVVSELSAYYVENKRGEALKKIIITADASVQAIGKVINDQLLKGVIEGRLYAMRSNELSGYFSDYNSKAKTDSFASKKKSLDEIYKKYIEMESATATMIQAQKAILSVMAAHSKIKDELKNDKFSSKKILKAISDIKIVHKNFNDLEELMISCETKIVSDDEKGIICEQSTEAY